MTFAARTKPFVLLDRSGRPYPCWEPGRYGGHRRSKIYGRLDCPAALRDLAQGAYARHRVFFADASDAAAAGYRPCGVCLPDAYTVWKSAKPSRTTTA
ncbi:MAG TPA: Ada metal-binding domain-containing protein [Chloroflexota bacterium]|nr:Ada metal-binding domain-containing protein [Chloroflexota bacterium]